MRKALFGILMATALTVPALAQEAEMPESYRRQAERNQANSDRQAAREVARAQRVEQRVERQSEPRFERREQRQEQRAQQQMDVQTQQHVRRERAQRESAQRVYPDDMPESYRRQGDRNQRAVQQQERRERLERRQDRRDWNNDRRWSDNRRWRDNRRDWNNGSRWGDDDRNWASNRHRWDRSWRHDRRYDWQRYRYSNRGIYRPGPYYSPYRNYGYNRFSIGITLGRDYYSNRYWINDPWQYRLPQPYAGTRWVRYYNDVLLVDVFNGQVLDVIHDFFW